MWALFLFNLQLQKKFLICKNMFCELPLCKQSKRKPPKPSTRQMPKREEQKPRKPTQKLQEVAKICQKNPRMPSTRQMPKHEEPKPSNRQMTLHYHIMNSTKKPKNSTKLAQPESRNAKYKYENTCRVSYPDRMYLALRRLAMAQGISIQEAQRRAVQAYLNLNGYPI